MKVWIVNPFDNLPAEGFRPQRYWLMSAAFAASGHETVFWTQDWSHALKSRRAPSVFTGGDGFSVKPVSVPGYHKNISFKRLWSHWRFAVNWRRAAEAQLRLSGKPDVIVVSSPPVFAGAEVRSFCRSHAVKYVVDVMDAWPETFERVAPRSALGWMRAVVGRNYRQADAVTAVASRYLELVKTYGCVAPQKLVYHGIDLSRRSSFARGAPLGEIKRLVYAGNMSLSYDLSTVVDAVRAEPSLTLDLAGSGPDEPSLRRRAGDCDRICFHGYLAQRELISLLEKADAGIVPMFDESCVGVPYKLADYAAAGLPVLSSLHGETEKLLCEHHAGVGYEASSPESFLAAVSALALGVQSGSVSADGIGSLAEKFDAKRLYADYVGFVAALV